MKLPRVLRPYIILFVSLVASSSLATADLVVTNSDAEDELAFADQVSDSDLINGNLGTVPDGSDDFSGLFGGRPVVTDGLHGNSGIDQPAIAWDQVNLGNTRVDYDLGAGDGFGYDLTLIRTVATWQSANFEDQRYNIYVATVAEPAFTLLNPTPVENLTDRAAGTTMTVLTDDAGVLASGVTAIRFEILPIASAISTSGTTYREFDVEGVATGSPGSFAITDIVRQGGGTPGVTITFNSVPGRNYAVDFATSLGPNGQPGGWQELTDSVTATGASTEFEDTFAAGQGFAELFYRVRDPALQPVP